MEALSQSFRALGDPTRLRLLRLLSAAPLNVSELVSIIGVGQSSISHHLSKLRQLGLVGEERAAGFTYYSLAVNAEDLHWPLIRLACQVEDDSGDQARLTDLLRQRVDRTALNERLLEPGQSWFLWSSALASLLPALDVADFGCGSGVLSASLARWARSVVAIDQNPEALGQARSRARREGLRNVTFVREDLHSLSLSGSTVDLVVLSQSLHHVEEPEAVLREAARLLRPRGKVVVLELMPHDETWVRGRLGHRHLGFSPARLEASLKRAGFGSLGREVHAREATSPFRVFLLTGEKR
jgi:2-polyprenyl-3-methyl-5-hydroxy-6-metoxy-1,4-benzoquinol methylase